MGLPTDQYPVWGGFRSIALLICIASILVSCESGGGSGNSSSALTDNTSTSPDNGNNRTPPAILNAKQGQALLGPIVDATVSVYKAEDFNGVPICTVMTSSQTDGRGPGVIDLSACSVSPTVIYFLIVRGGLDIDADDDGILDSVPTPKNGALRALLTGADIIRGGFRINIVTEIAYQSVSDILLTGGAGNDILDRLDVIANQLLREDINGDGLINNTDLIHFSPAIDADVLPPEMVGLIEEILVTILSGNRTVQTRLTRQLLLASLGEFDYLSLIIPKKQYQNFLVADFLVENGYLYAAGFEADSADNDLKILIIDVQDLSNVRAIGEVTLNNLPANPQQSGIQMAKIGDYLYLVSQGIGMIVADVSTRNAPVASLRVAGNNFYSIAKGGSNNLYVGAFDASVEPSQASISIYDVSNPSFPSLLSTLHDDFAFSMVYEEGYLYVYGSGLSVYDAGDRSSLVLMDNLAFPSGSGDKLAYKDGYVYLPTHESGAQGFSIYDVTNKLNIQFKESVSGFGFVSNMAIEDNMLFVGTSLEFDSALLTTFEITSPGNVSIRDSRSAPLNFYMDIEEDRVYLSGPTAFVAYDTASLNRRPNHFDFIQTPFTASAVEVVGNVAFVADDTTLLAVDVSTPGHGMRIIDEFNVSDHILDMQIVGDRAYLANSSAGLKVMNIENPAHMGIESSWIINPRPASNVTVLGEHAYIYSGGWPGQFSKVNNINTGSLEIVAEKNNIYSVVTDMAGKGNYIYTVGWGTLDILNADTLDLVTQQPLQAKAIAVSGNYAYTTSNTSGISIFNISDSSNPVLFGGQLGLGVGNAISVYEDIAYVANEFGYIEAYDISNKIAPRLIGISMVSGAVRDVFATENYVYAVNGFGLVIIPAINQGNLLGLN